jgi:hypothetical protein
VEDWLKEQEEVTRSEYKQIVDRLRRIEETDEERLRLIRKEQAYLRQLLFNNSQHWYCAICNKYYPVELLVAAHVKARSTCNRDERLDPNNVVPMCLFGCDAFF